MTYIIWLNDFAILLENYFIDYFILIFLMIKMLQYKMYPAGELRCPTTALVFFLIFLCKLSVTLQCESSAGADDSKEMFILIFTVKY